MECGNTSFLITDNDAPVSMSQKYFLLFNRKGTKLDNPSKDRIAWLVSKKLIIYAFIFICSSGIATMFLLFLRREYISLVAIISAK